VETFALTRIAGEESLNLMDPMPEVSEAGAVVLSGLRTDIPAGYYMLRVLLKSSDGLYAGKSEVVHIYRNLTAENLLEDYTFTKKDFNAYLVTTAADSGPGSLRQILEDTPWGQAVRVALEPGSVIELESPISIIKDVVIEGNGVTLTRASSWTETSNSSPLVRISDRVGERGSDDRATVTIRRVHFKNGQAENSGGAVQSNEGILTLESCVFSGNQTRDIRMGGGAVYSKQNLTIRGSTFYGNSATAPGGAVRLNVTGKTLTLTGNLFYGNTAKSYPVVYAETGSTVVASYNVADVAFGTEATESGWIVGTGDKRVLSLPLSPETFWLYGDGAANVLPSTLPAGYPAADFYGNPINGGGAAGAAQASVPGSDVVLTGAVTVAGTPQARQVLTANTGDLGGTGTIVYQWQRGESAEGLFADIPGEAHQTYVPETADQGKFFRVTVSRIGNNGALSSAAKGPLAAGGPTDFIDFAAYPSDRDFATALKDLLQEASPIENARSNPLPLKVRSLDVSTKLSVLTNALTRYVSLDLSEGGASFQDQYSLVNGPWCHIDLKESKWVIDLVLPAAVVSLPLQEQPLSTFNKAYSNLRSFVAPGVTKMSDSIFRHSAYLERVELPALKSMYDTSAFADCPSLKEVIIPSVELIGKWAFSNDTALETIVVGQIASVGPLAFEGANETFDLVVTGPTIWNQTTRQLSRVDGSKVTLLAWLSEDRSPANIPGNITKLGDNLFYGMTNITGVNLSASITEIGDNAFSNCSNLAQAALPGVTKLGEYAFLYTALVTVEFPEVTYVGPGALSMCLELVSVKLPKVVEVGSGAFWNGGFRSIPSSPDTPPDIIGKLASVDLGNSCEIIGSEAFAYCWNLKSLSLPATVRHIGYMAFSSGCKIETLTVNAVTPPVVEPHTSTSKLFGGISHLTWEIYPYALKTIYVPAGSVDAYKNAPEWDFYAKHIQPIVVD
jgi:predicted outer membrane repeat protein